MKKALSAALLLALIFTMAPAAWAATAGFGNFRETRSYEGQFSDVATAKLRSMLRRPESLRVHSVSFSRAPGQVSVGQTQYYLIGVSVSFTAEGLDGKDVRTEFIIFYNMDDPTEGDMGSLLTVKELEQVNNLLMDEYNVPTKLS